MQLSASIFKAYDIRGIIDETLDPSMGGARSDKSTEVSGTVDFSDKNSQDNCSVDPAECEKR